MSERKRNWCFTLNNWTEEEYDQIQKAPYHYVVVGKEVGDCGTPHLQGYIELENAKTLKALKKTLPERTHLEIRRGTAIQASEYCKKGGDFFESGEMSKPQGYRSDIAECCKIILDEKKIDTIANEHPCMFVKYHKGFSALLNTVQKHRTEKPIVYWIYGSAGIGKTKYAVELSSSYYFKPLNKWWDGYTQQETIIIDDLRKDDFAFNELLRLLDRYEYTGEVKGGTVKINSKNIVITSDEGPHHWWQGNDLAQIKRRIDKIIYLS